MKKDKIATNNNNNNNNFSPIQEWLNTYMQCIESLEYLKLDDFVQHPEKLIEKQICYSLSNTLKLQVYLKKSLAIMGKALTQNPLLFATNFAKDSSNLSVENLGQLPDIMMGRISNSIFTPTYLGLNPLELAQSFASDLTTDLSSKGAKSSNNLSNKTKKRKKI